MGIWNKLTVTLPKPLYGATSAITNDHKYVIIIGGRDAGDKTIDDILVLHTKNMEIKQSKISSGTFRAVIPSNKMNEELTVFGFVRRLWKNKDFKQLLFPPFYLIQIIAFFYNEEYLHLI